MHNIISSSRKFWMIDVIDWDLTKKMIMIIQYVLTIFKKKNHKYINPPTMAAESNKTKYKVKIWTLSAEWMNALSFIFLSVFFFPFSSHCYTRLVHLISLIAHGSDNVIYFLCVFLSYTFCATFHYQKNCFFFLRLFLSFLPFQIPK